MNAEHTFFMSRWLTAGLVVAIKRQASATAGNEIQVFYSISLVKLGFYYRAKGIEFATETNLALSLSI
jgi:hypothetical protein